MKQAWTIVQRGLMLLAIGAIGLGVYNITSDLTPTIKSARLALACPTESDCQLSRWDRRPWEQKLEFYIAGHGKVVRCQPQYLLFGEMQCRVTGEVAEPRQRAN